jgi:septal ring factor EnvC (AmiA/AmiB activator)
MKKRLGLVTLFALCFVVSCSSSGARSAGAFSTVDSTHKSLTAAHAQIDKTAQSLQKLLDQTGDLRETYKQFSGNVDRMNETAADVDKRASDLRDKRSEYVRAWTREGEGIRNEEIAQLSAARQQEMEMELNTLVDAMASARTAFVPYRQDLNDIRTYLKNDLTATGLQSIRPVAERILSGGAAVGESLNRADATLSVVSAKLAPRT